MQFTTLFIDLDDTLYPAGNGLWQAIKERIRQYMRERLGIPAQVVPELSHQYFLQYGTTLRGLQANYHVDMLDYLAYVHDVPLADYAAPNPGLCSILTSIPARNFLILLEFVVKEEMRHDGLKLCPEDSQHASMKVYQRPSGSYKTAEENHAPNRNGAIQRNCG